MVFQREKEQIAQSKKFEMWCWRRTEISWTNHVKNESRRRGI